jgi:hypothetical protein
MPAFCSTETLVKNDYKKSKKQDGVWGGSAVLVCFTESSGRVTLCRTELTNVAKT